MNIWKIKKTTARRIWALLLTVCMVLGCMPIVSLTASAQSIGNGYTISTGNTIGSNLLGSANSSTDTDSSTDTGTTVTSDGGAGATDAGTTVTAESDAGTTGTCSCGGSYINGICSNADCTAPYQEPTLTGGVYQIANAGNLYWFAAKVNSGSTSINAKLTADITVNESVLTDGKLPSDTSTLKRWTPIGNSETTAYTGKFNGDGHTISGLYNGDGDSYVGLFGYIKDGATIQNVGVIDSCFRAGAGCKLGGIVGYAKAETAPITISNCSSAALLAKTSVAGSACCGGVAGFVDTQKNGSVTIQNCFNTGEITATRADCGGVVGYASARVNDDKGTVTISNCYYLSTVANAAFGKQFGSSSITAPTDASKTADQFASGEVTWLLNGKTSEGTLVWKQTLGTDATPNFTSTQIVYAYTNCAGTTSYTNDSTKEQDSHDYDNGICKTDSTHYQPAVLKDDVYEISNLGQLLWFADKVNNGETSISAKLVADIDATSVSCIGIGKDAEHVFTGTFDGNNKTLKIALVSTDQYVAPFPHIGGATIKNLTVSGTIKTTHKFAAGIVGRVESGSAKLENCLSLVEIDSTDYSGDGTHGGLIAVAGEDSTTIINNCGFAGSIIGESTTSCGGIVGWAGSIVKISNSYVAATFTLQDNSGDTFARNQKYVAVTNCYYLNALSDTMYSGATKATDAQFASGEVANKLGSVWKQTIGTDATPNFTSTQIVYPYTNCVGTTFYTNDSTQESGLHDYNDNGLCKLDSTHYQPAVLNDGVYEIGNLGQLMWFGSKVNAQEITSHKAKLMADITIDNSVVWTPISLMDSCESSFEGGYHTITFANTREGSTFGLFGSYNYSTISNLYLKGSITCNQVGVLGALANSGYRTTVTNVISTVSITNTGNASTGGLFGRLGGKNEQAMIKNCAVYADISSAARAGGLIGENWGGTQHCYVQNSVYMGDVSGGTAGAIMGYNGLQSGCKSEFTRVYYCEKDGLELCGGTYGGTITQISVGAVTQSQFESGVVAYFLNGSSSSGIWKQTIGTDSYPNFTGKAVYYGYRSCADEQKVYTNSTVSDTLIAHTYGESGFCTAVAGETHYQPAVLNAGVYEISNAGQLYWFAAQVNGGETAINGKLMADIIINPGTFDENGKYTAKNGETARQWTPIGGSSNQYVGTFDGNNKSISGLYVNGTSSYTGLFGQIGNKGIVQNVAVKDFYIKGSSAGGVAGSNSGTITNCMSSGTVRGTSNYVGGVAGYNEGNITNCMSSGTVRGTSNYVGGVVGSNAGEITNCYNTGTVSGSRYVGGVVGMNEGNSLLGYGEITNCYNTGMVSGSYEVGGVIGRNNGDDPTNCYYLTGCATDSKGTVQYGIGNGTSGSTTADVADRTTGVTADQFTLGEVTYLLNGKSSAEDVVWKQTLDGKSYPGFVGKIVYYGYADCTTTTQSYINEPYTTQGHYYDNGICTRCGGYEEPTLVDGYYEIDNAGKLYWFAAKVNSVSGTASINGKLTDDITVNASVLTDGKLPTNTSAFKQWTPIGNDTVDYTGTFDGQNHTISGLFYSGSDGKVGLFGCIGGGATIQNVGVIDSCFQVSGEYAYLGGIVGFVYVYADAYTSTASVTISGCSSAALLVATAKKACVGGMIGAFDLGNGSATIQNCSNTGDITATYTSASGDFRCGGMIGGFALYNGSVTMQNCSNTGKLTVTFASGDSYSGGMAGYVDTYGNGALTIQNCFNTGELTATSTSGDSYSGGVAGYVSAYGGVDNQGKVTLYNCYYTAANAYGGIYDSSDSPQVTTDKLETKTVDAFTSGEVTYLLNGKSADENVVWKQTLDGKSYPGFTGEIVYYGYADCTATEQSYINEPYTTQGHHYDNGICKRCGGYEEPTRNDDGYYEIDNAGKLYWFAAKVNSGSTSINAKLTANIVINPGTFDENGNYTPADSEDSDAQPRAWTPIGSKFSSSYKGTFDGNGKSISGLYVNSNSLYVALFGNVDIGGTVKNVAIKDAYIKGSSTFVGGVVGNNYGTITNCCVSGTVIGFERVGGVAGDNNGTTTSCMSIAAVSGTIYVGGVVGGSTGGTVTNCYYLGDSETDDFDGTTAKTETQFASGEVTWLLNGEKPDGVWKQTLTGENADAMPNFTSKDTVYSGYEQCKETKIYTNDSDKASTLVAAPHDYDDDGFCTKTEGETHYEPCEGEETAEKPYLIKNAGNLYWFADQVNNGNRSINAKLADNIIVNPGTFDKDGNYTPGKDEAAGTTPRTWTPIGDYTGTFDGNNKYISGLYHSSDGNAVGLFASVGSGATVKDVGVVNCYFSALSYVGGVAGNNSGTITGCYTTGTVTGSAIVGGVVGINYKTVTNCTSSATVSGTSDTIGGVVGRNSEYGTVTNCTGTGAVTGPVGVGGVVGDNETHGEVTNCANTGTVTATDNDVGGVVGGNLGTVMSCYNIGTVSGTLVTIGGVVGRNGDDGTVTNCYYLTGCASSGIGADYGTVTNVGALSAADFASGKATWLLNGERSEGTTESPLVWKQTLSGENIDALPGFTGKIVYRNYTSCKDTEYSNTHGSATPWPHNFTSDGFCTVCGGYQPCDGEGTDTNPYLIKNAGNLYWFAAKVNGGEYNACAKLTDNITVNPGTFDKDGKYTAKAGEAVREWTPIGGSEQEKRYSGTFDGNNKSISGLYFNNTKTSYVGLFACVGANATVKNVAVKNSYFKGNDFVGGVVGKSYGTITGCSNSGTVTGTGDNVGGVVGGTEGGSITNCYNTGTVSGFNSVGGVVGYNYKTLTNCYNTGTVSGTLNNSCYIGGVVGRNDNSKTNSITNCYYLTGCATDGTGTVQNGIGNETKGSTTEDTDGVTAGKTEAQFTSGEVTYLLNGGRSEGTDDDPLVWFQTIGEQTYPGFSGNIVYQYTDCTGGAHYTNASGTENGLHKFNENGFCVYSNSHYQPAVLNGSTYEISNAGQLYWFAQQVNGGKTNINARLTGNIKADKNIAWTPIGNSGKKYSGTFDGNYFTISGLKCEGNQYIGLFGYNTGTIQNVSVADSYFKANAYTSYVGGIVGYNDHGTVKNCSNAATVALTNTSSAAYCGGIVGSNQYGTISNCYNVGAIGNFPSHRTDAQMVNVGGIAGGSRKGTISNCYNTGTVKGSYFVGAIVGANQNGAQIINCYYLAGCAVDEHRLYYTQTTQNGVGASDSGSTTGDSAGSTTKKSLDQFKSGEVAWLLNGSSSDGLWKQKLGDGGDATPNFTSDPVYGKQTNCDTDSWTGEYTNEKPNFEHNIGENGVCTVCGKAYQSAVWNETLNAYEIHNVGQLFWFAAHVNAGNYDVNGILMTDLDLSGYNWTPIAYLSMSDTATVGYRGIFDGNFHVISNIAVVTPKSATANGIFGIITTGTVKNLGVDKLVFDNNGYDHRAGGIAGQLMSGGVIENCYVINSTIKASSRVVGGIVGMCKGTVKNCYTSSLTLAGSANRFGGITGDYQGGSIVNCYTGHSALGSTASSVGTADSRSRAGVSAEVFASGEITWLLNGSAASGVWKQTIGTDGLPSFKGSTVYVVASTCSPNGTKEYTNEVTVAPEHVYDENGMCKQVEGEIHYQPAELKNGYYEISNLGQLLWFADKVNNNAENAINGKLKADIDATSEAFSGIGTDASKFAGIFDGNGHTLTIKLDSTVQYVAPFRYVNGATIRNLIVTGSISTNSKFAASLIGLSEGNVTIEKCLSFVVITSTVDGDGTHGGFVANVSSGTMTINHCGFLGEINGASTTSCGGFVGWSNATTNISNSYISATFGISTTNCRMFSRGNGVTVNNCYYVNALGDVESGATQVTAADLSSGKLTYLLNGSTSAGDLVWKQRLNVDNYPNFIGLIVCYDGNSYYNGQIASVAITWTAMSFSYNKGTWNTDTMRWEGGGWEADAGCGTVTVKNTGNLDVTARFGATFTDDTLGISVSFIENDVLLEDKKIKVLTGKEKTVTVKLTGDEPSEYIETATTIGQITITLSAE